jgi:hypothetical protein
VASHLPQKLIIRVRVLQVYYIWKWLNMHWLWLELTNKGIGLKLKKEWLAKCSGLIGWSHENIRSGLIICQWQIRPSCSNFPYIYGFIFVFGHRDSSCRFEILFKHVKNKSLFLRLPRGIMGPPPEQKIPASNPASV